MYRIIQKRLMSFLLCSYHCLGMSTRTIVLFYLFNLRDYKHDTRINISYTISNNVGDTDENSNSTAIFKQFPNDDACVELLMRKHYGESLDCPKCSKHGKFHRIKRHPAYKCGWCGYEIYPMKGTIFDKSHVPLQKWFYALYLFTTTRHGVTAKELQRQLGVSYPTALRMAHIIREHVAETDGKWPLDGEIVADEIYIGGKRPGTRGRGAADKTVVFGMLKCNGDVMAKVVPDVKKCTLAVDCR